MEIFVLDGRDVPHPEDLAMLQALYSRSPTSVLHHLEKLRTVGSGRFIENYYIGYGHKSIGDCGDTAIFVENCSILAAKAIQDTPLYSGQEASTRYLDMTKQAMVDPVGTDESKAIQSAWMELYANAISELRWTLRLEHPRKPEEKESVYEKAINARAFDIARSLLPAGISTYVSWKTNLRQAADHLGYLDFHPLLEVQKLAEHIRVYLGEKYTASFGRDASLSKAGEAYSKLSKEEANYMRDSAARFAFLDKPTSANQFDWGADLEPISLHDRELLARRPKRAELHHRFRAAGVFSFSCGLDYGSYRDLQRHRSAVQEMPLLSTDHGFHPWYLERLPVGFPLKIEELRQRVLALECSKEVRQYYTALGFVVPVVMSCTLPAAVYIAEIRSGQSVHPTLRLIAQKMGRAIRAVLPSIALYVDETPDVWSLKRGTQDIEAKK